MSKRSPVSKTRKNYLWRFIGRVLIFALCILIYFYLPKSFVVLNSRNFLKTFSPLHLLWVIWMFDIILQIIPIKNEIPIGSQKLFANRFKPIKENFNRKKLTNYITSTTRSAYKVMIIWLALIFTLGILYFDHKISKEILFLISVFFYVCDLICVLFWCPFRLIMKNKCCTTCRIFNWDHLMMFSPLIFIGGFYSISLLGMSIIAWFVWEFCVLVYPERFCEMTNTALKCSECTDKLCTQYCQKLRKPTKKDKLSN